MLHLNFSYLKRRCNVWQCTENSHRTFCVFEFCKIASFKYRKLSNKSTSITLALIKIQNICWAHIFTCRPIFPNCQPRFWCFYICLHKFGIIPSRGKTIYCEGAYGHVALWNFTLCFEPSGLPPLNRTLRIYNQILKVLL